MAGEPTVRWGSHGDAVVDLQTRLAGRGYDPGTIDGDFGPRTDGAVRQFQADHGLVADGVVAPMTWGALEPAPVPVPEPTPAPQPTTVPQSHVVFVENPLVQGGILSYKAARIDRAPIAVGTHVDSWIVESADNPMVAFDTVTVPFEDTSDGVYQVMVALPEFDPGTYNLRVGLTVTSGSSEVGHATFAVGAGQQAVAPSHVVFVEDPLVEGGILSYKAARIDRAPIAAGAHVDSWIVESATNPMVASDTVSVPLVDAPTGVYQVMVALPEFDPGAYNLRVGLTVTSGSSEVGHATFTV
jgi:peptidoglycan hydrolase-like protein with peptidoglycan-binding domain